MRKSIDPQLKFGDVDISEIKFDPKCRDELPRILQGLQHIYLTASLRKEVFSKLDSLLPATISKAKGRPGMDLWKILVLGVVRLGCNWNYDKLHDMANNHLTIRKMLGHGDENWEKLHKYNLQTIKDNVMLITPEVLEEINLIVVRAGHNLLGGKKSAITRQCRFLCSRNKCGLSYRRQITMGLYEKCNSPDLALMRENGASRLEKRKIYL